MSLIGRFFSDKDDDKKKSGKDGKRRPSTRKRRTPSTRRAPSGSARKMPSSVKRPAGGGSEAPVADAIADMKPRGPSTARSGRKKRVSLKNKQLGALLIKGGTIDDAKLNEALTIQTEKGGLLGHILQDLGYCTKADVGSVLKKQRTITTVELANLRFDPEALELLDRAFCERNRLIPFEKMGNQVCVAMANVLDPQAKNDIKERTQLQVKMFDATWQEIKEAIDKHLPGDEAAAATEAPAAADAAPADEDLVIELPDEEIDVISDVDEMPTAAAAQVAVGPQTAAPAPPSVAPEPAPQPVSIDELRKARARQIPAAAEAKTEPTAAEEETVKEAIAPPAAEPAAAEATEEILEIEDIGEIEEVAPAAATEAVEEIEEVEELEEVAEVAEAPAVAEVAETIEPVAPAAEAVEPIEDLEAAAALEDIEEVVELEEVSEVEEVAPVEEPALAAEVEEPEAVAEAVEAMAAVEPEAVADIEEIAEVEEIGAIEIEPVAEVPAAEEAEPELVGVADLVEPEAGEALQGLEAAEPVAEVAEIEDLGIETIEEIPEPAVQLDVRALPEGRLQAIPMSAGYFSEVVQWGEADAERRWLAEHLADNALPVRPAPDLLAS